MGFFAKTEGGKKKVPKLSTELLHSLQCRACPLDKIKENLHPHMAPTGAEDPVVLILGEGPGREEDEENVQFIGRSGQLLRGNVPKEWIPQIRWNNVVRTRPPGNRTPDKIEVECCRPSVREDIERSKPTAIFGFGNIPLQWVSNFTGITDWRGRRFPVKVGNHTCWYYAFQHPAFIIRLKGWSGDSEPERVFKLDLKKAFNEIESLEEPKVHTRLDAERGVEILTGKPGDLLKLSEFVETALEHDIIGFDYETSNLRPYAENAKILSFAFSMGYTSVGVALSHKEASWTDDEFALVTELLEKLLRSKTKKTVHNLAFEMEWSAWAFGDDILRTTRWEDSMSQANVLDGRVGGQKPGCFGLEFLCQQYFGFNLKALSNLDRASLSDAPLDELLSYNAMDAKYHLLLYREQAARIKAERLTKVYEMMLQRVPTMVLMQMQGIFVDQKQVLKLETKYKARVIEVEKAIKDSEIIKKFKDTTRREFKPESPRDVIFLLKDMLKRTEGVVKKGDKEKYSTDESVLESIDHPICKLILLHRKAIKKLSTYITPYNKGNKNGVLFPDGRVHSTYSTVFAITGRTSSGGPNLQNIPVRTAEGTEIRTQMIAGKGKKFLKVDYGQIEARVTAMASKDPVYVKALFERYDIHAEWAQRIAKAYPSKIGGKQNLTDKKVMKDLRQEIKSGWTFALIYGAQLSTCAEVLKIPIEPLIPLEREFWKTFSGTREWQNSTLVEYKTKGYVTALTGRRLRAPMDRNKIFNYPIQGAATDIACDAMNRLSEMNIPTLQPVNMIHDDILWCINDEDIEDVKQIVLDATLAKSFDFMNVPISVEMSVGSVWADMKKVGEFHSDEWYKKGEGGW